MAIPNKGVLKWTFWPIALSGFMLSSACSDGTATPDSQTQNTVAPTRTASACSSAQSTATGTATIGGPFELTDQSGAAFSDQNLKGRYALVYFGFAFCPDVCPSSLMRIGAATRQLPESLRTNLQPVFISLDPERDTPAKLDAYVNADPFSENLIGLTGSQTAIDAAAGHYKVYWDKVPDEDSAAGYTIAHSDLIYLMGTDGNLLDIFTADDNPDEISACITHYMQTDNVPVSP